MLHLVSIAAGGTVGALLRYFISRSITQSFYASFPFGTLAVNFIGCFLIGFLFDLFDTIIVSTDLKAFLTIGFLGSLTTFSTFSLETINLFRNGEIKLAVINLIISNITGLTLVVAGVFGSRILLKVIR